MRRKFGVGNFYGKHRRQPLPDVVPRYLGLRLGGHAGLVHVRVQATGQCAAKSGKVRPSVPLRNIVGETENVFLVGIIPLHGQLDDDPVAFRVDIYNRLMQWGLVPVQMPDKLGNTPLVFKQVTFAVALVPKLYPDA